MVIKNTLLPLVMRIDCDYGNLIYCHYGNEIEMFEDEDFIMT